MEPSVVEDFSSRGIHEAILAPVPPRLPVGFSYWIRPSYLSVLPGFSNRLFHPFSIATGKVLRRIFSRLIVQDPMVSGVTVLQWLCSENRFTEHSEAIAFLHQAITAKKEGGNGAGSYLSGVEGGKGINVFLLRDASKKPCVLFVGWNPVLRSWQLDAADSTNIGCSLTRGSRIFYPKE